LAAFAEQFVAADADRFTLAVQRVEDHVLKRVTEPDTLVRAADPGVDGLDEHPPAVVGVITLVELRLVDVGKRHAGGGVPLAALDVEDQCLHRTS